MNLDTDRILSMSDLDITHPFTDLLNHSPPTCHTRGNHVGNGTLMCLTSRGSYVPLRLVRSRQDPCPCLHEPESTRTRRRRNCSTRKTRSVGSTDLTTLRSSVRGHVRIPLPSFPSTNWFKRGPRCKTILTGVGFP